VADLTELIEIDPSRVDGVRSPASGLPILLMKALSDPAEPDKTPDTSGTETVKDTEVPEVKDDKTPETPESQVEPQVEKSAAELLDEAVAKAVTPLREVIKGLEAEMAVLKSTPVPGGPAVTTTATASEGQRAQSLAKAAYHDRLAKTVGDRELVRYHEEKAKEARQAANG